MSDSQKNFVRLAESLQRRTSFQKQTVITGGWVVAVVDTVWHRFPPSLNLAVENTTSTLRTDIDSTESWDLAHNISDHKRHKIHTHAHLVGRFEFNRSLFSYLLKQLIFTARLKMLWPAHAFESWATVIQFINYQSSLLRSLVLIPSTAYCLIISNACFHAERTIISLILEFKLLSPFWLRTTF